MKLSQSIFDDKLILVQLMVWSGQHTKVDLDLCRHVASLGRNAFKFKEFVIPQLFKLHYAYSCQYKSSEWALNMSDSTVLDKVL